MLMKRLGPGIFSVTAGRRRPNLCLSNLMGSMPANQAVTWKAATPKASGPARRASARPKGPDSKSGWSEKRNLAVCLTFPSQKDFQTNSTEATATSQTRKVSHGLGPPMRSARVSGLTKRDGHSVQVERGKRDLEQRVELHGEHLGGDLVV
mmetsp:Transcript_73941/g.228483  ORF Transcript_73941/g.228483 Transcript_73941/m.228483 type:complete len:151 (+) Transcript_73941:878-1330(+)